MQSKIIGFILMGLWCLFTAFSQVFTGSITQSIPMVVREFNQ